MMNFREIIERIKTQSGMSQAEIASSIFCISSTNLSNKIKRDSIDLEALIRWADNESVNLNWLLNGKGRPCLKDGDTGLGCGVADADAEYGQEQEADSELIELMRMTREIIGSKTSYAVSLAANIRSFHQAICAERRFNDLEQRIANMEKRAQEQDEQIRKDDPPEEKDEIIKRRAM